MKSNLEIQTYTAGLVETNSYLLSSDGHWVVIDAPEGVADFLKEKNITPAKLIITHGHWDHMWDAAEVAKRYSCPVYYHKGDAELCLNPDKMRAFGLPVKLEAVKATSFLEEGDAVEFGKCKFQIFHVPGHSLGSICLYEAHEGVLFAGDVLFAGGVGRWDLPGGSNQVLIKGIREKLLTLPEKTVVYPGHGATTTIGREQKSNPFL